MPSRSEGESLCENDVNSGRQCRALGQCLTRNDYRNSPLTSMQGSPAPSRSTVDAYQETAHFDRNNGADAPRGHSHGPPLDAQKYNRAPSQGTRTVGDSAGLHGDSKPGAARTMPPGSTSLKRVSDLGNAAKRVASPAISASDRTGSKSNGRRDSSLVRHRNDGRADRTQPSVSDHELAEADHDPTPYCYCQKQSYGEMIGCDSDECRYEWVSSSTRDL